MNRDNLLESFVARLRDFMVYTVDVPPRTTDDPAAAVGRREQAGHTSRKTADLNHSAFNALALELFQLQRDRNASYRKLCEGRIAPATALQHWSDIPAVPAAAFKEWELSCLLPKEATTIFLSSGTTEHRPSRHFHHQRSLEIYELSLLLWFRVHFSGCSSSPAVSADRKTAPRKDHGPSMLHALALTPNTKQAPHSSLVHMFDTVRRQFDFRTFAFTGAIAPDGAWVLDCATALERMQHAQSCGEPVLLLGTAFSFVHLLDYLAERDLNIVLPPGSRVLETGGYKGRSRVLPKAELHSLLTRRLGLPNSHIICEYGMSELSSQAYDTGVSLPDSTNPDAAEDELQSSSERCFRFPPWAKGTVVSPETGHEVSEGETGLLRVLDLANVYSVMAIQTEDLAIRRGEGFELIGRAAVAEPRGCSLMARETPHFPPIAGADLRHALGH